MDLTHYAETSILVIIVEIVGYKLCTLRIDILTVKN